MSQLQEKLYGLKESSDEGVKNISTGDFSSYSEIFIESEKYLDILTKHKSEIVSVVLPNSIVYFEVLISCILTGNIFNPIPYFTSDKELERIFKYVDSKLLITDRENITSHKSQLRINPKKIKNTKEKMFTRIYHFLKEAKLHLFIIHQGRLATLKEFYILMIISFI